MNDKQLAPVQKLPWGIFAGVLAMIWSIVTIAIIVVFVVSGMMYADVGSDDGLSQSWWLIPLYVTEGVTVIGFGISVFFYVWREKTIKQIKKQQRLQSQGGVA